MRELVDTLNCINNGLYESPKDLSDCLHATAESIRLVLNPDEFTSDVPQLLDAIAVLYIALQLAANEAALFHPYPQDHAATFDRWAQSAIDTVTTTPGDQLRDLITGTVARLAQLRAQLHHPVPHVVYFPTVPERNNAHAAGGPPEGSQVSPEAWELGKQALRNFFENPSDRPPAPWPAWLTPDDTPTAADPDHEEPSDVY